MNLDDDHPQDAIRRVGREFVAGKRDVPNLTVEKLLVLSQFRNEHNLPTHYSQILPPEFSTGLHYPRPFKKEKIDDDIRWYFAFCKDCNCCESFGKPCVACSVLLDIQEEHLEKQLETEQYMHDMKKRVRKWRKHEERNLHGGHLLKRITNSIKKIGAEGADSEPFNVESLPRWSRRAWSERVDVDDEMDSERDNPQLTLVRTQALDEKKPISLVPAG